MAKVIESPVKKWPGKITISDPLSMIQVLALEEVVNERDAYHKNGASEEGDEAVNGHSMIKSRSLLIPALIGCVESWDLEGLDKPNGIEDWPGSPLKESGELINWMFTEIWALLELSTEVPNDS